MDDYSPLRGFAIEWACYLEQRGHEIRQPSLCPDMLRSRNGRGVAYRWLLFHARGSTRRLTPIERENMLRQLRAGRKAGELVYVAVRFDRPINKVLVLHAEKAAKLGRLRSDKGGIPWDW